VSAVCHTALSNRSGWIAAFVVILLTTAGAHAQTNFGLQPVGAKSGATTVNVTLPSGGTVSSMEVLTLGVPGTTNPLLDFQAASGGFTCVSSVTLAANGTCQQSVTFDPTTPGLRIGAVELFDSGGDVLGTTLVSGTGLGGLGVLVPANTAPVAGDGLYLGTDNDGKAATLAELYWPTSQVLDGAGNLYIADSLHNRIRMVCASSNAATSQTIKGTYAGCTAPGVIVTIAGNGNASYSAAPGPASAATLNDPSGLAIDGAGNLYIADTNNGVIRMISAVTGIISTIAGSNPAAVCGTASNTVGDGCLATAATLSSPEGVTLDGAGNLYIADTNDHRIRMVTISTGDISTVAGNGTITDPSTGAGGYSGDHGLATAAELNYPYTVAFDPSGNMYIPDSGNNRIREVAASSIITTFAGTGVQGYAGNSDVATHAELDSPHGVAVDAAANVYIADSGNNAIRKVSGATNIITALVVNKTGTTYVGGTIVQNSLFGPSGLYLDGAGNLYVADSANMIVREVQGNYVVLDYRNPAVRQFSPSAVLKDQTVENDGNAPLDGITITPDTNATFNEAGISDPCPNPGSLAVNADCEIGPVFAPQVAASPLVANIDVFGNTQDGPPAVAAPNSPLDIQIIGNATAVNSTTVTVSSNSNPAGFGQEVTLTATVQTGSGTRDLIGTVTFFLNGTAIVSATNLGVGPTNTSGSNSTATVQFPTMTLPVGVDEITATYNVANDPNHLTSNNNASPYPQQILEATKTVLNASPNPSNLGQTVTFTATVSIFGGGGVTPDGTVTFFADGNAIGSPSINGSGVASVQDAALTLGDHTITAQYSGGIVNPSVAPSNSNPVTQDVQGASSVVVANGLPNPSNYGQTVTFSATVTPAGSTPATGAVKFYYGTQLLGTGNLVTGTNQTKITYSGLPVGTDNITAQYAGDVNNAPSTTAAPYPQVVMKTQTTTTVSATPQPNGIAGGSVSITATVQIVSGNATLGGTVSFSSNGNSLGAPVAVNSSSGKATLTLNNVVPATYSIIATYSGDPNDDVSVSSPAYPYTVVQATTQTTVTATPNPALIGQTVTFTAKVTGNGGTPGGSVTFEANGTAIGAPATLDGTGTATLTSSSLAAGSYTITAIYGGDTDDQGSTGTALSQLVVGTIPTTTSLASASTTGTTPQVVLVAVVLNSEQVTGGTTPMPTGTVTFKNGATVIGTATLDTNGVATLPLNLPTGTYTITAVYGGDASHTGSTSQPISVSTTATSFNLTVTPGTVTMATQQNYTVNVALTSVGGFNDSIGLGCASLPAGVTCHFTPVSVALAANATATAQLTIDTNNPLSGGAQAMNAPPGSRRTVLAGIFVPFALFFGWIFWSFRRRNGRFLTMVLVLALSAAALLATGCGGFSQTDAMPGTYTIQVTGTGINSGVIHYQSVTLTIT
jgi:hypothetical protein